MPAPIEPLRYCVLLHAIPQQGVHYDLLLSVPRQEALAAWRLLVWPPRFEDGEQAVVMLPDHRRFYLEYEGPVSGNRGDVRRVESGLVEYRQQEDDVVRVCLCSSDGDRWLIKLWREKTRAVGHDQWQMLLEPEPRVPNRRARQRSRE